jgi:ribulose-phosphate 3-epimerase
MLHVDCMDGHFVPNLTIGPCVVEALRRATELPLDVHLMIADPGRYLDAFLEAGSDLLTFHREAVDDPAPLLARIAEAGAVPGLAISPGTPVERVADLLDRAGMIVVMTVEPGFGGQSFLEEVLPKIRWIRDRKGPDYPIEVDGGVDRSTAILAREAGANVLVAGTAIFGADDRSEAIANLRGNGRG